MSLDELTYSALFFAQELGHRLCGINPTNDDLRTLLRLAVEVSYEMHKGWIILLGDTEGSQLRELTKLIADPQLKG